MLKGRSFPERITVMLPPTPSDGPRVKQAEEKHLNDEKRDFETSPLSNSFSVKQETAALLRASEREPVSASSQPAQSAEVLQTLSSSETNAPLSVGLDDTLIMEPPMLLASTLEQPAAKHPIPEEPSTATPEILSPAAKTISENIPIPSALETDLQKAEQNHPALPTGSEDLPTHGSAAELSLPQHAPPPSVEAKTFRVDTERTETLPETTLSETALPIPLELMSVPDSQEKQPVTKAETAISQELPRTVRPETLTVHKDMSVAPLDSEKHETVAHNAIVPPDPEPRLDHSQLDRKENSALPCPSTEVAAKATNAQPMAIAKDTQTKPEGPESVRDDSQLTVAKDAMVEVVAPVLKQEAPPTAAAAETSEKQSQEMRRIAVTGNPNCGKSTLFNALTGLRQKVGNYPGVTVEKKEGSFFGSHGEQMQLLDLPGCYSLQARSPDEAVSRDVLLGRQADTPRPDAILAVLDSTNLERNLYLLAQLLELGLPVFLALNMVDLAEARGMVIDPQLLSERLGVPVLPLVASKGVGIVALKQALSQAVLPLPKLRAPLPKAFETEAERIAEILPKNGAEFAEAVLLLGMPDTLLEQSALAGPDQLAAISESRLRLEAAEIDPLSAAVDARYEWIGKIIADTVRNAEEPGLSLSDKLDSILTHRIWGWGAFLAAMAVMFFSIFTIAKIPTDWISAGQELLGNWLQTVLPDGDFRSLVIDGALAGVAGVLVFLPQILILTFFLGLLEDTGYMARAAFLMDRLMSRVGLHGKSFIPMLSSFACAIPGIMATRTIEQRKDRLVTILVSPLMSCSARLPVYTLLIGVLLPDVSVWQKAGIMLSMYLIGILAAFVMAGLFKKTLLRSDTPVLLMEMPPYRRPSLRGIVTRMMERASIFLKRAGSVILALSVLLWALTTYPKPADPNATGSERIAYSVAGRLGKAIEPVIAPLGFDWKIGIGLIGSFAAREVFVSTMGIVYSVENSGNETPVTALSEAMRLEKRDDGTPVYTPLTGTALMVFYVLAMQCLSTLTVVRRETNSWKWPLFQFIYMTTLAYAGAWLVFHVGHLFGWH